MTRNDTWRLIGVGCATFVLAWALIRVFVYAPFRIERVRALVVELRPVAFAAIVGHHLAFTAIYGNPFDVKNILGTGLLLATWFTDRDDDDRWKRRRRKARERITRTASGRLAVEPT